MDSYCMTHVCFICRHFQFSCLDPRSLPCNTALCKQNENAKAKSSYPLSTSACPWGATGLLHEIKISYIVGGFLSIFETYGLFDNHMEMVYWDRNY